MQTITERPARGAGAISRQLAAQERRARKASQRVRKLREIASAEIERLIAFLDQTDGYTMTELEPSLGAAEIPPTFNHFSEKYRFFYTLDGDQRRWAVGATDDREVEDEHDEDTIDREEVCEDEGAEHDGAEPDEDGEPSLGWTCDASAGTGAWGGCSDLEADGSYVTEAARDRYKPFDRYSADDNKDGKHVDTERGYGRARRHLTNLSDQQKKMLGTEWVR